jgi:hypothetical protein
LRMQACGFRVQAPHSSLADNCCLGLCISVCAI